MKVKSVSRRRGIMDFGIAGIASAAVLFAGAQFVSAFFATASAPVVAMGGVFIDLTPPWLKDLAIATFGTNDKLALFISIGIVVLVIAGLVGVLARKSLAAASA